MEIQIDRLCFGCFQEKSTPVCPFCGFDSGLPDQSPMALPPGSILNGKYLVGKVLGQGGFGITYLGYDLVLQIKTAIKEYLPTGTVSRDTDHATLTLLSRRDEEQYVTGKEKFLEEARILARLQNVPHIVKVQDYFLENNTAYFVMEYIEGMSLKAMLKQQGGHLSYEQSKSLLFPIAEALSQVHANNLLHRDISPDNIYITLTGQSKLLDFGAARYSLGDQKSMSVILKHGFAPEEQYRTRGNQGPWTDIYALAATFYNCMTGALPPDAIERLHQDTLRPTSELGVAIPPVAEAALMKALNIRAEDRLNNMNEFISAFSGQPIQSGAPPVAIYNATTMPVFSGSTVAGPMGSGMPGQNQPPSERGFLQKWWWVAIGGGILLIAAVVLIVVLATRPPAIESVGGGGGNVPPPVTSFAPVSVPPESQAPSSEPEEESPAPPSSEPESEPEPSKPDETSKPSTETYVCDKLGFLIELPEGWRADESSIDKDKCVNFYSPRDTSVTINYMEGITKENLKEKKQEFMDGMAEEFSGTANFLSEFSYDINGNDCYTLAFGIMLEDYSSYVYNLYAFNGPDNSCYLISNIWSTESFDADESAQVTDIVWSFQAAG